ncbi:MAG: CHAT domain-containing protein [Bacteroidota bacterium]
MTSDPKHDTNSPSKIIYDSYWSPIKNALPENITKAYLSPAGIYNSINLNTLYNEKYLIDEINLQYVSTTAVLLEPEANILEKDSRNISLIGNPSYHMSDEDYDIYVNRLTRDEEKRGGNIAKWLKRKVIPPLPATQVEVEEISQLFHQNQWKVTTYLRAEANEDNFKLLNNPTILHVATHGYFVGKEGLDQETGELNDYLNYSYQATDAMLKSGLLLAGVSNYYKSHDYPAIEDGLLTAYETTTLNLNNTDLVVLSACETGLGRIESGEGVYGLQRALKIAGANTLLMSLWKVSDQVTEELMVSFYHHLLESGDKRQAFEKAQKEIKEIYPQPHYWGAFIMLD